MRFKPVDDPMDDLSLIFEVGKRFRSYSVKDPEGRVVSGVSVVSQNGYIRIDTEKHGIPEQEAVSVMRELGYEQIKDERTPTQDPIRHKQLSGGLIIES